MTGSMPPDLRLPEPVRRLAEGLQGLAGLTDLRLGGSRARGNPTSLSSDWDLLGYVEELPETADLAALLPVEFELSATSPDDPMAEVELSCHTSPRIDVSFRRLPAVLGERRAIAAGSFTVHALPKLPAGVPSYLLLTELAWSAPILGELSAPDCPPSFVRVAAPWWRGRAALSMLLAIDHADAAEPIDAVGHVLAGVTALAHARLLERIGWYPITKRLLNEPAAVTDRIRSELGELSPHSVTSRGVRRIAELAGLDERVGLDWLAAGQYLGPRGRPQHTHAEPTPLEE